MKTISTLDDLRSYGIVPLTGEACGLMYRILFDVTKRGKKILEKAFDVSELRLRENWNCGADTDPHVGCIMLPHDMLPFIGVFALLESGCKEVWLTKSGSVIGTQRTDRKEDVERFKQFHADDLARRFSYAGTAGDRNEHMMSGRIH